MSIYPVQLLKRSIPVGPEDPAAMNKIVHDALGKDLWRFFDLLYTSMVLSGSMVVFLIAAFLWRRSVVNRVSLRLIFAMSVCDFIQSMVSYKNMHLKSKVQCRTAGFFVDYTTASSIYLSSSIAFNLQMVFLRKSRKPLPKYTEILYYVIPLTVALLQFTPQYIWAAKHGYCYTFDPVPAGTASYILHVILAYELIPGIFVFYNLITSTRVIITLYMRQRKVSRALKEASHETRLLLNGATAESEEQNGNISSGGKRRSSLSSKDVRQLEAVRRVYRACMRIALYPVVPLWWWISSAIFYWCQYPLNMTFRWHATRMLHLYRLSWTTFSAVIILNFAVFSTDPSVLSVMKEVRKSILKRLGRLDTSHEFNAESSHDAVNTIKHKQQGVVITEHTDSGTIHGDGNSMNSGDLANYKLQQDSVEYSPSALEESGSISTAYASLYDDSLMRRARAPGNTGDLYDNI
ncbi:hypothetical protein LPJ73_003866 [Coemansia sp. RSA 2703]|nr:hypothetical protein LPJ73_003866 [Coemansia sp. RSA 2703]